MQLHGNVQGAIIDPEDKKIERAEAALAVLFVSAFALVLGFYIESCGLQPFQFDFVRE